MITNINDGVDPARIQQHEPPFFVNWQENGKNNYKFISLCFVAEDFKNRLLKRQKEETI